MPDKQIEHKNLDFEVKDVDEQKGTVEGLASTFGNMDSYRDIVEPGAFKKTLSERMKKPGIKVLWQHDWDFPIGKTTEAEETKDGLRVIGKLTRGIAKAEEALKLIADGVINQLSIGYVTMKDEYDSENRVRHLKEVKLMEWSPVTFAANEQAVITGVKSYNDLLAALRAGTLTEAQIAELKALIDAEPGEPTRKGDEPPHDADEPDADALHSLSELLTRFNQTAAV